MGAFDTFFKIIIPALAAIVYLVYKIATNWDSILEIFSGNQYPPISPPYNSTKRGEWKSETNLEYLIPYIDEALDTVIIQLSDVEMDEAFDYAVHEWPKNTKSEDENIIYLPFDNFNKDNSKEDIDLSDSTSFDSSKENKTTIIRKEILFQVYMLICTDCKEYSDIVTKVEEFYADKCSKTIERVITIAATYVAVKLEKVGIVISGVIVSASILLSIKIMLRIGKNTWCSYIYGRNDDFPKPSNVPIFAKQNRSMK